MTYNSNELEVATIDIEDKNQSTSSLSCSETNKNKNKLEVITPVNIDCIIENSYALAENTIYDSTTDMCDSNLNELTDNNENCSEAQNQGAFNTEAAEVDGNKDTEESTDDNEEQVYNVPYDDYGYWINVENIEEDKQETPFLSIKNIKSTVTTNNLYEEGRCIICLSEKSKIAFIPCGHLCCCKDCIQKLLQEKCPACNTPYSKYILIITP
ncbi:E3 ubiquitin-protein ligase cblA-like isoform X2 [Solenopsis invicta]|uniref:E3 ubiquitin-protein ligase cblA-like isoform X2 n=1 Tax=Solenopsis invicta TaxID=13686 RepID=UPI00193E0D6C|nr:E3 ubiquitin-protein ligase cblA-like isoform X2 [Solenopsis invicta]